MCPELPLRAAGTPASRPWLRTPMHTSPSPQALRVTLTSKGILSWHREGLLIPRCRRTALSCWQSQGEGLTTASLPPRGCSRMILTLSIACWTAGGGRRGRKARASTCYARQRPAFRDGSQEGMLRRPRFGGILRWYLPRCTASLCQQAGCGHHRLLLFCASSSTRNVASPGRCALSRWGRKGRSTLLNCPKQGREALCGVLSAVEGPTAQLASSRASVQAAPGRTAREIVFGSFRSRSSPSGFCSASGH